MCITQPRRIFSLNEVFKGALHCLAWGAEKEITMQNAMTLQEVLESIRSILNKDLVGKPTLRNRAVADPALWRAIQNQQRNSSEGPCGFRSGPGKP